MPVFIFFDLSSSSSNKIHPSVIPSIIKLVLCTFADKEACDQEHFSKK